MNSQLLEMNLWESIDALRKSGFSVELLSVPCSAAGKSDAPFLSTVREFTIKLKPPANWGIKDE